MKITITVERQMGDHQAVTQELEWGDSNFEWHEITTRGATLLHAVACKFGDVNRRPSTWPGERGMGTGERGVPVEIGDVQAELERLQRQQQRGARPQDRPGR